jgi:hypothetical protein
MRSVHCAVVLGFALAASDLASAQGSGTAQGFGGLSVGQLAEPTPSLGGTLTVALTEHVHLVGEAGRLGNVLPPLANEAFSIPGVRVSAFYGEGGVRAFAGRSTAGVRPYVEGTVGASRLNVTSSRLSPLGNAALGLGTALLDRTSPTLGVGGGLLAQAGPVVIDLGYRYKELLNTGTLGTVLGLGQGLRTHEVRAGIGFRF